MSFFFRNFFSKKSAISTSDSKLLTEPVKIAAMLQRLIDNRVLLTIKLPSDQDRYSSAIVSVDKANNIFTLDEISPKTGHQHFLRDGKCFVEGHLNGVEISFHTKLGKAGQSSGIAYYENQLPAELKYLQRRASFRSKISAATRIQVSVYHKTSARTIYGNLADISIHGANLIFLSTCVMHRGDILKSCRIKIPSGSMLTFDIEVRFVQDLHNGRTRVGARFCNLDRINKRRIEKFVRKIEREQLKLRRK